MRNQKTEKIDQPYLSFYTNNKLPKVFFSNKKKIIGNLDFFGGDLEVPGSYNEAVKGCEGVFVCALPEKPR